MPPICSIIPLLVELATIAGEIFDNDVAQSTFFPFLVKKRRFLTDFKQGITSCRNRRFFTVFSANLGYAMAG